MFYIINIIGSYVVLSQPVYHVIEKSDWYRSLAGLDDNKEKAPEDKADSKNASE